MDELSVCILAGDRVVASSDNPGAVRLAAAAVAGTITEPSRLLRPIAEARRLICRDVASRGGREDA